MPSNVVDEGRLKIGNCFETKEEAEKALKWLKAFKVLRDDVKKIPSVGYKIKNEVWNVGAVPTTGTFAVSCACYRKLPVIEFETQDAAEKSLELHEKEWRIFLGVEG